MSMGLGNGKGNLDLNDGDFAYGGTISNPNQGNLGLPIDFSARISDRSMRGNKRTMYRNHPNSQRNHPNS